ncbi:MAG: hypothetical protein K2P37_01115 [Oscillospiraceae bacterium]|nr:hypothetical protein [Oscillospiraceae bacterium]
MKRTYVLMIVLLLCLNILTSPAAALGTLERIDFDDGSYAIITTEIVSQTRTEISDSKTYTYYNASGQRCFAYTLYATFTYNGSTSSADECYYLADIYHRGWDISTHREYTSGSTAYGSATFTGPDGQTRPVYLSLTCSRNGNVT